MFTENMEAEIEVERVTLLECNRRVSVAVQRRNIFIITFKVDTIQRLAYWTVQYMGPKKYAHTFDYEIHVSNKHEPRRKVIFREYCTSDSVKTEDIFSKCCCAVLSLKALQAFSIGDKVSYRVIILKHQPKHNSKQEFGKGQPCPPSATGDRGQRDN